MEGKLDSLSSRGGSWSIKLVSSCYTLWSHQTSQEPCLPQVPFSITLPCTFQDGDESFSLPPSYHFIEHGIQSLLARSTYQLHFIVTRVRYQKLDRIWPKERQYVYLPTLASLPFIYWSFTLASSSLSNMYLEHGQRNPWSLLLAFSHLSKHLQRNGIRQ